MLAAGILFGLAGCELANDTEEEPTAYPTEVANVIVEEAPTRVVCLSPSLAELVTALGQEKLLVGRTEDTADESLAALPTVGKTGHIDSSALVGLEPDTVLTHVSLSRKEMEALEAARIQVIVLPMAQYLDELEELYKNLGLLFYGALTGKTEGKQLYQALTDRLEAIRQKLPEEPSFLYLINPSTGTAATGDTLEGSVLSKVFGENVAAAGTGYAVELKAMAEQNPDVIFVAEPYGLAHLTQDSTLKALSAVKEERVATVDPELFAGQGEGLVEAVEVLARTLYPEQFPEEEPTSSADTSAAASQTQSKK